MTEPKKLELSDLATKQETEIIKNPYQFLNLPQDAPLEDVRRSYISLAHKYHPDLVNPNNFDPQKLRELYSSRDVKFAELDYSLDEIVKIMDNPFGIDK